MSTLLAAGLMLQAAFGQGKGGGAASGTMPGGSTSVPGSSSTANSLPPSASTTTTTTPTNPQPAGQLPIFLSGRVMLEDGTAPTEIAVIERVCNGQTHAEGYTDSKGYFAIQLFQRNTGVMQDASDETGGRHSGIGGMGGMGGGSQTGGASPMGTSSGTFGQDRMLMDCDLRARLAGYRSQSVPLANHRPMDLPDVGTILMHRIGPSEGSTVSAVSLAAPKDAQKAYQKGLEALKKSKVEDARKDFTKAVQSYPNYAAAWYELGKIQAEGDTESARKSFEAAVQADPKFVPPYLELGALHLKAHRWPELADISAKAMKLDPFDPQGFYCNAVANYYLKQMDEAEKSARETERLDTRHQFPQNYHLLGVLLWRHQDYSGAAEQFRKYLKLTPGAEDAETVRTQLSQVEKLLAQGGTKN